MAKSKSSGAGSVNAGQGVRLNRTGDDSWSDKSGANTISRITEGQFAGAYKVTAGVTEEDSFYPPVQKISGFTGKANTRKEALEIIRQYHKDAADKDYYRQLLAKRKK